MWFRSPTRELNYPEDFRIRSTEQVAPSFSWASIKEEVFFPTTHSYFQTSPGQRFVASIEQSYVEVLKAGCKPSSSDPMGQVKSGYLRLKGRAVRGYVTARDLQQTRANVDFRLNMDGVNDPFLYYAGRNHRFQADIVKEEMWNYQAEEEKGNGISVVCVPMARVLAKIVN
jgi:hypothetical protein